MTGEKFRKIFLLAVLRNNINPKCKSWEIQLLGECVKTSRNVRETMGVLSRLRILSSRASVESLINTAVENGKTVKHSLTAADYIVVVDNNQQA